jgi:hypothetical protein
MKKAFVLCALVGVAVYATTAWSASNADPTVARLVKDVATLKSQVKTLQKQVKTLNANTGDAVAALAILGICSTELDADALQGTWQIVDQLAAAQAEAPGKTYFGPQTPITATVSGRDWCSLANVARSQVLPPTVAQYQALLAPFHSSSALLGKAGLSLLREQLHLK